MGTLGYGETPIAEETVKTEVAAAETTEKVEEPAESTDTCCGCDCESPAPTDEKTGE